MCARECHSPGNGLAVGACQPTHCVCTGYDNMEVNLEPVLDYIKAQNYKALEHEQNAKRDTGMNKWEVYTACSGISCSRMHSQVAYRWNRFLAQSLCMCDAYTPILQLGPLQTNKLWSIHECFFCVLHIVHRARFHKFFPSTGSSCRRMRLLHCSAQTEANGCGVHEAVVTGESRFGT